jgi:phage shock protein C
MEISLEMNNSFEEKTKMAKKLYRSSKQRMIAGVCGGLAEYFDMDVNIMRLLFVAISLLSVLVPMAIFYIIAWIIIPEKELPKKS